MHRLFVPGPLKAQRNFDFSPEHIRPGDIGEGRINAATLLQHFLPIPVEAIALRKPKWAAKRAAVSHYS
jgi:hypothetical protein